MRSLTKTSRLAVKATTTLHYIFNSYSVVINTYYHKESKATFNIANKNSYLIV